MRSFLDDLRFGFRMLLSRPGFSMIAVLTLALGISVTTAMFSVLDTMYWKAYPGAADPGRLVELETVAPDGAKVRGSWLDFRQYRDHLRLVSGVAAHDDTTFNLGLSETARPVRGELVSGTFFAVLGVKAALGRVFTAGRDHRYAGRPPGGRDQSPPVDHGVRGQTGRDRQNPTRQPS